ncbi:ankyrin repeat domain-containing protein [Teredinibacter franksiae]|uniref:ankyrin repeat domain-containing protein n=1 Tax=Teredinibacter franksiae TaxID=2761453 RepID=UPI001625E956|nr:ankyrin repeat domain-containing protein [Teredinibacter franksiae]
MRLLFFSLILLGMSVKSFAEECEKAKISYLLERATYHEDKIAFNFALELGADPNGVTRDLAIKCFGGMPTNFPVLHAASHESTEMLEALLEEGASPNASCCGSSALQVATENGNITAVKLLKHYGAKN